MSVKIRIFSACRVRVRCLPSIAGKPRKGALGSPEKARWEASALL
jgi:hypothetical protein